MPRGDPTSTTDPGHVCRECGLVFARREHLKRHLRRHSGARPHACPTCGKTFSRPDSLKRHVGMHGPAALADLRLVQPVAVRPACRACAKSKQRCEGRDIGGEACDTCRKKGRECVIDRSHVKRASVMTSRDLAASMSPTVGAEEDPPADQRNQDAVMSQTAEQNASSEFDQTNVGLNGMNIEQQDLGLQPWDDFLLDPGNLVFSLLPSPVDEWASAAFPNDEGMPAPTDENFQSYMIDEEDALISDHVQHVPAVPAETHAKIVSFVGDHFPSHKHQFPSLAHFDVYVQLYFEHFQARMPFLHQPTFSTDVDSWHLVLATAAMGCQYSTSREVSKHMIIFRDLARHIVQRDVIEHQSLDDLLSSTQTLLICHHFLAFAGSRSDLIFAQAHRNMLLVYCRKLLAPHGSLLREQQRDERLDDSACWKEWITSEVKYRVLYFSWILECLHGVLIVVPPLLGLHEMQLPLPCSERLWEASEQTWHNSRDNAILHARQSTQSLCAVLGTVTTDPGALINLSPSARLAVYLAVYTQYASARDLDQTVRTPQFSPYFALVTSMQNCLEVTLTNLLEPGHTGEIARSSQFCDIVVRLLLIFSFTPPRLLYPFCHWQTTTAGSERAREKLQDIMKLQPKRARVCALQAARLLGLFRQRGLLIHADPICLLVATIYLVAYTELVVIPLPTSSVSAPVDNAVIRLDQPLEAGQVVAWIEHTGHMRPHLAGVGLLDTPRSTSRLWKESARIMAIGGSKSRLALTLSRLLTAHAQGEIPQLSPHD